MKRRSFLTAVTMGAGAGAAITARSAADPRSDQPEVVKPPTDAELVAGMPRRQLGTTGKYLSIVGYAGFALRDKDRSQAECTASLGKALESGINYFDVAPAYDDGLCEIRMGQGFSEIGAYRRESIFLACKTRQRTRAGAQEELERSLRRLKTDYFDLYQLHALTDVDEVGYCLDRVNAAGIPVVSTLGRHTNDRMLSFYMATPGGFALEFGCEGLQMDWEGYTPTVSTLPSLWGHKFQA